ncbi:hypothetical protein EMIHUDRAFT_218116 [Emiliania huxleyi CCMP1516]|uniref:Uncharacterized protein n=2 Tax=Emiliania huxleyi TaxID=2903 RepID=A0A0D3I8P9_EMIH1|nr:hypothetical protein EMIHUDRAFT_218116 [Emiliania huxleyi CCMP1516]EOD07634.1 hypothetical protein EMIHUDRAFT_218116 [Emiliania huxleyi CCMP1516]|eukprot:XP_005760063.1 hypothetical protein EMIHUDRAFT_218116 [Emiliania huxleyi CCMP1516]
MHGIHVAYAVPAHDYGGYACDQCKSLVSIKLPATPITFEGEAHFAQAGTSTESSALDVEWGGLTSIGYSTFSRSGLRTVDLSGAAVQTIEAYAFYGCVQLEQVDLSGSNVNTVGNGAFESCSSLASIKLPATDANFGQAAFGRSGTESSTLVVDWGGVTVFGYAMFSGSGMRELDLSGTAIHTIKGYACDQCKSLVSIKLPATPITFEGEAHFAQAGTSTESSALDVEWGGLTSIGYSTFSRSGLRTVDLSGAAVQTIEAYAFYGCVQLEQVDLSGSNVNTVGNGAFESCSSLASIKLPATDVTFGTHAFSGSGTESSTLIVDWGGVTVFGYAMFSGSGMRELDLSGTAVRTIGAYACNSCTSLTSLTLPQGMGLIESWAFASCTLLSWTYVPPTCIIEPHAFEGTQGYGANYPPSPPSPPLSLRKPRTSAGSAFAWKFLAKVTDGKSKTFGKSKKQTSPWFSAKAPQRFLPCHLLVVTTENQQPISSVTVTRDTKNKPSKAKKYLNGFEIWVGKKAGEKAVKCGGPFAWSKIKKGPVTAPCDAAKSKRACLPSNRHASIPTSSRDDA